MNSITNKIIEKNCLTVQPSTTSSKVRASWEEFSEFFSHAGNAVDKLSDTLNNAERAFTKGFKKIFTNCDSQRRKNELLNEQSKTLQFLTVNPKIYNRTKKYICYDGFGRILSVKNAIPKKTYELILKSTKSALTQTPVKKPHDAKITVGEALINLYLALDMHAVSGDVKSKCLTFLKTLYLGGKTELNDFNSAVDFLKVNLGVDIPNKLSEKIDSLANRCSDNMEITRQNDNFYGRTLDSCFAKQVVENQNKSTKDIIFGIQDELIKDFVAQDLSAQKDLSSEIANKLKADLAPWIHSIPTAIEFIKEPSPKNFKIMMSSQDNSKYILDLCLSVAVKYITTSKSYEVLLNTVSEIYTDVILKQRSLLRAPNSMEWSVRSGITLNYQPQAYDTPRTFGLGVRPIDRYQRNVTEITEHDQLALKQERGIGIGMSGSANILNGLFAKINDSNPAFNIKNAQLLAAAHLTFSGGHSINEAYTVFSYSDNGNYAPTSYNDLYMQYRDSEMHDLFTSALESSFLTLIEASRFANQT